MAKPKAKGTPKRTPTTSAARKPPVSKAAAATDSPAEPPAPKPAPLKRTAKTARAPAVVLQQADRLDRLWDAIQAVRDGRRDSPRTARLLASGVPKLAQKVVEEAAETAIEAVRGQRLALINESVDLLYNLAALWNGLGVAPSAIWAEMDRREATLGMAEKLPKTDEA